MTITSVATSTFLKDSVLMIRDDLIANITDPITAKRTGDEKFVMTSYPQRISKYPLITIRRRSISVPFASGTQATVHYIQIPLEIRVWARNVVERESLAQDIINRFRTARLTTYAAGGMFDFQVTSTIDVDEGGDAGIHSVLIYVQYNFVLGS